MRFSKRQLELLITYKKSHLNEDVYLNEEFLNKALNWLNNYVKTTLKPIELSDRLTDLGLECTFEKRGLSFSNVVIGKVVECKPHENSDYLSICTVKTDEDLPFNVVCGAPNVEKGMKVVYAPVGSTIPVNQMKIKAAKIRGVESYGMMCSEYELGISNEHDGIIRLEEKETIGRSFSEIYGLNDIVIEIGITPNRQDCLGVKGIARDLASAGMGELLERKISKEKGISFSDALEQAIAIITPNTFSNDGKTNIDELDKSPVTRAEKMANYKALSKLLDYGRQLPPFSKKIPIKYNQLRDDFETMQKERFMYDSPKMKKGGLMKIPVRKNSEGIKELDMRKTGGFVPIGVKEKADDVPAMLSKNEFVMTADAVRGAGDGNIKKGAQRMYDLMKRNEGKVV